MIYYRRSHVKCMKLTNVRSHAFLYKRRTHTHIPGVGKIWQNTTADLPVCCAYKSRHTGLLKMIVGFLTTCHKQCTSDRSICIFLYNRTTLQVFVTYLTGALYVHPLWFYKHQHDNRVRSTQNAFSLRFAAILVNCAPSGEMHNYCTPHIIKENSENFLIHRCNYILLSQVYCVWQAVKTPTVIFNNPVFAEVCALLTGRVAQSASRLPAVRMTELMPGRDTFLLFPLISTLSHVSWIVTKTHRYSSDD